MCATIEKPSAASSGFRYPSDASTSPIAFLRLHPGHITNIQPLTAQIVALKRISKRYLRHHRQSRPYNASKGQIAGSKRQQVSQGNAHFNHFSAFISIQITCINVDIVNVFKSKRILEPPFFSKRRAHLNHFSVGIYRSNKNHPMVETTTCGFPRKQVFQEYADFKRASAFNYILITNTNVSTTVNKSKCSS